MSQAMSNLSARATLGGAPVRARTNRRATAQAPRAITSMAKVRGHPGGGHAVAQSGSARAVHQRGNTSILFPPTYMQPPVHPCVPERSETKDARVKARGSAGGTIADGVRDR
jgi:hypothetical protein